MRTTHLQPNAQFELKSSVCVLFDSFRENVKLDGTFFLVGSCCSAVQGERRPASQIHPLIQLNIYR